MVASAPRPPSAPPALSFPTIACALLTVALLALGAGPVAHAQDAVPAAADTVAVDTVAVDTTAPIPADSIALRIEAVFDRLAGLEQIDVSEYLGVVQLTGTVVEEEGGQRAEEVAASFPGVIYVLNDIETNIEVEARVSPALERVQEYVTNAVEYLPVLVVALIVVLLFWFLSALTERLQSSFERLGLVPLMANLVTRMLRFVVFVVGLVLALDVLGITTLVGAILGTAGVLGVAIGFAFQDIIENYLAGLLLSIRQPFNLNDVISIDDVTGKVVRLTSRELLIMTFDGNHVRIPNANVFKSVLTNYTRNPRRRFEFSLGIDVEEDLAVAQELGVATLRAMPGVLDQPEPFAVVADVGDSNVAVTFYGWVNQKEADFLKVRSTAIRLVKTAFDEADIVMPEPIYIVKSIPMAPAAEKAEEAPGRKELSPVVKQEAAQADIAPGDGIDAQIQEDLATSSEANLLDGAPPART